MNREKIKEHFNSLAHTRADWKKKAKFYHKSLGKLYAFLIPKHKRVLEIGCGTGELLAVVEPSHGLGIDISENMIAIAKKRHRRLQFMAMDAHKLTLQEKFDYVIMADLVGNLDDVQKAFEELHKISGPQTRIIVSYYNRLWEPLLGLLEKLKLKMPQPPQNWLSQTDIENLLVLANFDVVKKGTATLLPMYIPIISALINKFIAKLPVVKHLCLVQYLVARQNPALLSDKDYPVSLIIPARNEGGNIEEAVVKVPKLGTKTQFVFVEGHSKDNTREEIKRVIKKYGGRKDIILVDQKSGIGKADAVRKGFEAATGDICIIFDSDLTVSPDDLPKFYQAIRVRKGELVQGSRLVYPMEKQAMRFLNILGNKFFSIAFTWLLDQPIKDTLCGTKGIFKDDYERLRKNRSYFGDFDPFGDFDLIFGASKLNMKIIEIPIRYKARTYGTTNISRFTHGWLLLKMTLIAAKKIKFV